MIQEFNKELKGAEDRLIEIFREITARNTRDTFLKSYFISSCKLQPTIVTFSPSQIKVLFSVLERNASSLALVRPIDKDPIYKVRRNFDYIK